MPGARRAVAALLAAVGWLALVLQLGIMLRNAANAGTSLLAAVGSFLSFFTVLTNLLVAVALAATASSGTRLAPSSWPTSSCTMSCRWRT